MSSPRSSTPAPPTRGRRGRRRGLLVDQAGKRLLDGGGTTVLTGSGSRVAAGGGDAFDDGTAKRFAHQYYDAADGGRETLDIQGMTFANGWPAGAGLA